MYDDDDKKDDGSVWTSYSDLFTTVAVIFLVMFVFALIKAGVSKMQQVVEKQQHEQELKGKVTEKNKKQTEKKISKVNKSLAEIAQYEDIISTKMKEMNTFVAKLQDNKKVMKDLIEDQKRKETLLVVVKEKIEKAEEKVKITRLQNQKLNEVLENKQETIKTLDQEKTVLNSNIDELKKELTKVDEKLVSEEKIKKDLSLELNETKKVVEKISQEKEQRDFKIQDLEKKIVDNDEKSKTQINTLNNHLEQKILLEKDLTNKLDEKITKMEKLDQMVRELDAQVHHKKEELINTQNQVADQETIIEEQSKRITQLDQWKSQKSKILNNLNTKLAEMTNETQEQQKQNQKLVQMNQQLGKNKELLEQNLKQKNQEFNQKKLELNKLNIAHENISEELNKVHLDYQSLQIKKKSLDNKVVQYEDLIGSLQKENKDWKGKTQVLERSHSKQIAKINHLSQESKSLKLTNSQLQHNLAQTTQAMKDSKTKSDYYEKMLSDKNIDIQTLTASLGNARSQISNYKGQLDNTQMMNDKLSNSNSRLEGQVANLNRVYKQLEHQNVQLRQQLSASEVMNNGLQSTNDRLMAETTQMQQSNSSLNQKVAGLSSIVDGMKQKLAGQESINSNLQNENKSLMAEMNNLKTTKGQASRKIASVEAEVDTIKMQHQQQSQQLMACQKDLNLGQKRLKEIQGKFASKLNTMDSKKNLFLTCKKQKAGLVKTNQDLKESLDDFATKVANVKGKLRSSIASDLAEAFKKAKLSVMVDKKTGNVVFLMNKNFRFKKNSAYLNKAARTTLKKVIPIYSKVLFGNKDIKDKVAGFNVVGHASPSHGGKYVAPLSQNSRAYSYNMRLSAQRAASVTNYIFGNKIGTYSYKRLLKDFTRAIGQGYTKPIKNMGRGIASKGSCGPYNCHASQRVELSFTLKDDVDSINKLIQMAKDIK